MTFRTPDKQLVYEEKELSHAFYLSFSVALHDSQKLSQLLDVWSSSIDHHGHPDQDYSHHV